MRYVCNEISPYSVGSSSRSRSSLSSAFIAVNRSRFSWRRSAIELMLIPSSPNSSSDPNVAFYSKIKISNPLAAFDASSIGADIFCDTNIITTAASNIVPAEIRSIYLKPSIAVLRSVRQVFQEKGISHRHYAEDIERSLTPGLSGPQKRISFKCYYIASTCFRKLIQQSAVIRIIYPVKRTVSAPHHIAHTRRYIVCFWKNILYRHFFRTYRISAR